MFVALTIAFLFVALAAFIAGVRYAVPVERAVSVAATSVWKFARPLR